MSNENRLQRYPFRPVDTFKNAAQVQQERSGLGVVNTASPGQNMGLTLDQVKEIIANSEKVIGVTFTSAAGSVSPDVKFPSTAKYLLGFSFSPIANLADTFTMTINEEIAIKEGSAYGFSNRSGTPDASFFQFLRIIGGSTSLNIDYNSAVGGEKIVFTAHYV